MPGVDDGRGEGRPVQEASFYHKWVAKAPGIRRGVSGPPSAVDEALVGEEEIHLLVLLDLGGVLDQLEGGAGHTAEWNFHSALHAELLPDKSVRLSGAKTYRLCPAQPEQISDVKTHRHWAAVLPGDCQPADCGKLVDAIAFQKRLGEAGGTFAVALFQGDGEVSQLGPGRYRLTTGKETYAILASRDDKPLELDGVVAAARLAVVQYSGSRPARWWVVDGRRLTVRGQVLLDAEGPKTMEGRASGGPSIAR